MRLIRSLFYRACGALLMSLLTSQPSLGNSSPLQCIFQLLLILPAVAPIDSYYGSRPTSFFGKKNLILSLPTAPDHRIWVLQSLFRFSCFKCFWVSVSFIDDLASSVRIDSGAASAFGLAIYLASLIRNVLQALMVVGWLPVQINHSRIALPSPSSSWGSPSALFLSLVSNIARPPLSPREMKEIGMYRK